jgi:predicted acetyltransferase
MLELWLIEAKKLWIQKALLTCDIDNIWSNKVILKNGWVFERVTIDGTVNRYWIEL